ncbi:C-C motif chemokine 22 isoform X2 [Alligator mississippiensis]|uniref:C-C motif chemokine 22 isoform X2 n=1 Tax=Alligator mississippiensis TaxID=8496 RepID=UPI0028778491|nr:C-C motif chemokine 22 isoform X2 [Alligator mississippiensis]XP_059569657.1 C-C motif chemokine 22 isoform X2 [Alligator mississippiensis]
MYVTLFALGQPKSFVGCATMCKGFTKELPLRLLKSYKKTDPSCPKSVIIFVTKKSREICANPEDSWVKERVRELDQKNAPPTLSPSNPISFVSAQEKAGIFQRVIGGVMSSATQTSGPGCVTRPMDSPSHTAGVTLSEAVNVSTVRAEGTNFPILLAQEAMGLFTKTSSLFPDTNTATYSEPATYGSKVSMRLVSHPTYAPDTSLSGLTPYAVRRPESFTESTEPSISRKADAPTTDHYRFILHSTLVMTGSQSNIGSTEESTGSPASAISDVPGTVPNIFNSDPTWIMKGFDRFTVSTGKSTGATVSPVTDKSDAIPRRFTSDAPSIESSSGSTIFQTTLALLKSVPSKPAEEFTLMGRVMESYTLTLADGVKGSVAVTGLTTHSSVEGETSSFSKNRDNTRQVGSDSASRGEDNTSNHSYHVQKEDSSQSIPESISPADTSVFISTTSLEMNRARMPTEIPDIPLASSLSFLARYQTLVYSLVFLAAVLCVGTAVIYIKSMALGGKVAKEMVQGVLYSQQRYEAINYSVDI